MNKLLLSTLVILLHIVSFAQTNNNSSHLKVENQNFHLILDTLNVQTIKQHAIVQRWYESTAMPWIISLVICVLTVGINIYLAKINQKTSILNVASQISASTIVAKSQIENSKEIAIEQIQNSKALASTQFKATLNTKNRQDWINELRHSISEFLSQCVILNIMMFSKNKEKFLDRINSSFEKMYYHTSKIAMLLNVDKDEQKDVLNSIYDMTAIFSGTESHNSTNVTQFKEKEEAILKASRHLFGIHWDKIKSI